MVQIVSGTKGKGKTKYLLDMANNAIKTAKGDVVYLDKSIKHMYELHNKIRLINVQDYPVDTTDGFIGFICGIICQNHDLEQMYLDSFLKIAFLEGQDIEPALTHLKRIGEKYHVDFILSVSLDKTEIPESAQKDIIVSL